MESEKDVVTYVTVCWLGRTGYPRLSWYHQPSLRLFASKTGCWWTSCWFMNRKGSGIACGLLGSIIHHVAYSSQHIYSYGQKRSFILCSIAECMSVVHIGGPRFIQLIPSAKIQGASQSQGNWSNHCSAARTHEVNLRQGAKQSTPGWVALQKVQAD